MSERPYQVQAHAAILGELETHRSTLLVLPVGAGKTRTFVGVAEAFRPQGRILVLAHRTELITQAVAQVKLWTTLTTGIEMAELRCSSPLFRPDVVVASVQSLGQMSRLREYSPDDFSLIIVDEAHHVREEGQYGRILSYFENAKILAVTATPDRLDRKKLPFDSIAFVYTIHDAISDGWLVPISQKRVVLLDLDLSKVRTTAGDLNEGDLDRIMREDRHLFATAAPIVEHSGNRPTMVFAVTVAHAKGLAAAINATKPNSALAMDGSWGSQERKDGLADFRAGKFQYLLGCALFTEGFDEPSISCVAMARPTKSRSLYVQAIGRGTRLHPESSKSNLLVLDFVGNAGRHDLVGTLDVLGGDMDARLGELAQEIADEGVPVLEAIEQAQQRIEDENAKRKAAEIENERLRGIRATSRSMLQDVGDIGGDMDAVAARAGISVAQQQLLLKVGLSSSEISALKPGEAGRIIATAKSRWKNDLSTWKQIKVLSRFMPTPKARALTFADASAAIDRIAKNGWRAPADL